MIDLLSMDAASKLAIWIPVILVVCQTVKKTIENTKLNELAHGWLMRGVVGVISLLILAIPELVPALEGGLTKAELLEWLQWSVTAYLGSLVAHEPVRKLAYTKE